MSWNWGNWPWSTSVERNATAVQQRVRKIASPDLAQWAAQTLGGVSVNLSRWERHRDTSWLDDAITGAEALTEVLKEIRRR